MTEPLSPIDATIDVTPLSARWQATGGAVMGGMAPTGRPLQVWALCATIALVALACARAAEPASDGPRTDLVGAAATEAVYALAPGP